MGKIRGALKVSAIALIPTLAALGTSGQASATSAAQPNTSSAPVASSTHAHASWAGLWVGVEGQFVFISLTRPGEYELEMMGETEQPKDNIRLVGRDAKGGIAFERDGKPLRLRSATGEETGLKWLADKKKCLMVEEGEGFCQ